MVNMLRSVSYSVRRDITVLLTLFTMLVLPYLIAVISGAGGRDGITGSEYTLYVASEISILFVFAALILACRTTAGDMADKTMHYEVLSGHSRSSIFIARFLTGVIWSVLLPLLLFVLPMAVFTFLNGWGNEAELWPVAQRYLLLFFPLLRLTAFYTMIAFLMRHAGKGVAVGYLIIMVEAILSSVLEEVLEISGTYMFGMVNIGTIMSFRNAQEVMVGDQVQIVYDSSLPAGLAWKTILVSLALAGLFIAVTYVDFKRRDRD